MTLQVDLNTSNSVAYQAWHANKDTTRLGVWCGKQLCILPSNSSRWKNFTWWLFQKLGLLTTDHHAVRNLKHSVKILLNSSIKANPKPISAQQVEPTPQQTNTIPEPKSEPVSPIKEFEKTQSEGVPEAGQQNLTLSARRPEEKIQNLLSKITLAAKIWVKEDAEKIKLDDLLKNFTKIAEQSDLEKSKTTIESFHVNMQSLLKNLAAAYLVNVCESNVKKFAKNADAAKLDPLLSDLASVKTLDDLDMFKEKIGKFSQTIQNSLDCLGKAYIAAAAATAVKSPIKRK